MRVERTGSKIVHFGHIRLLAVCETDSRNGGETSWEANWTKVENFSDGLVATKNCFQKPGLTYMVLR